MAKKALKSAPVAPQAPAKRGRRTKFNDSLKETILRLLEDGKTDDQIAEIVGVSRRTIVNWKGRHPDFLLAVREAKQIADDLVEASLFSRAVGYSHPEQKVFCSEGQIVTHDIVKQYPPDTTAAMFWLRNRQPKRWREKNEGDVNVNVNGLKTMTDEELERRMTELETKLGRKK